MSKKRVIALRTIYTGKKLGQSKDAKVEKIGHAPGTALDLDAADADRLVEAGHARLPVSEIEAETRPSKPSNVDAVRAAILGVIPNLNEDEDFTAKGVPSTSALENRLGYPVTAGERDAAWAERKASLV